MALIVKFGLLLMLGLLLYKPAVPNAESIGCDRNHRWRVSQIIGLIALFTLFVGQTGFLAYVVQEAVERGMTISESTWAIAAMKIAAGAWLVGITIFGVAKKRRHRLLELGTLLAISLGIASQTTIPPIFLLSLLTFEVTFNTLSARFQAALANTNRHLVGRWLTGTLLLGAAFGPPLYGAATSANLGSCFVILALCSAIVPAIWAQFSDTRTG